MFRNKEVKRFAWCFIGVAFVFSVLGFCVNRVAGGLMLLATISFWGMFYLFTKARYKVIAKMADQIDIVLHGEEQLSFSELEEGELSILQGEITKMMLRIREQNQALQHEKCHLAESLADIAHQLRTPLTSANLLLSLMKNNPEERERRGMLRETETLYAQMDWLITSLLKLSRLDAGIVTFQKEQVQVTDLIKVALQPFLITMDLHNVQVETNIPEVVSLFIDRGWMSEALQNILKNCIESVGDNGKLEIACVDNVLYTELTIHDNGPGFEKEDLYHLFDRFYRGKSSNASGYGIGMALCRTIIMGQGGTITAKNHKVGGAIFAIRFQK